MTSNKPLNGFLVVLCLGVMLACAVIAGCEESKQSRVNDFGGTTTRISGGVGSYFRVTTVDHDGHKYVVANVGHGISVIHSPACPCQEKK